MILITGISLLGGEVERDEIRHCVARFVCCNRLIYKHENFSKLYCVRVACSFRTLCTCIPCGRQHCRGTWSASPLTMTLQLWPIPTLLCAVRMLPSRHISGASSTDDFVSDDAWLREATRVRVCWTEVRDGKGEGEEAAEGDNKEEKGYSRHGGEVATAKADTALHRHCPC